MKFAVRFQGIIDVTDEPDLFDRLDGASQPTDAEVMEDHLDGVMDELLTLGAEDPAIDLEISTGRVTFTVTIDGQNPVAAIAQASGLFRTAIHAAGGCTPDWPNPDHDAWSLRLLDVQSSEVTTEAEPVDEQDLVDA